MQLKSSTAIAAYAVILLQLINWTTARRGFGPGEQDWNYVEVRKGAHLFYWLQYTTANVSSFYERPLAIWFKGGVASTGVGCFEYVGPIDIEGQPRASNWVQHMNVLFIDTPVGTGFSYVESFVEFGQNDTQNALDLVTLMAYFLRSHPEFQRVPLHIISESYGGKMAPEFGLELHLAQQRGEVQCQLKSVVVGNPYTSPVDNVLAYAPFLLQHGIVDHDGYSKISRAAEKFAYLVNVGNARDMVEELFKIHDMFDEIGGKIDVSNIQRRNHLDYHLRHEVNKNLRDFMVNNVTKALNLTHMPRWDEHNRLVQNALVPLIFKPGVNSVTRLLDETPIHMVVYSGTLDLVVPTPATVNWIDQMQWGSKKSYVDATRRPFRVDGFIEGYEKQGGNFSMFWVLRAGHLVHQDNPAAMAYILREITNFE